MRIAGRRSDGALHLALGGGLSVVLAGDRASPPVDETQALKLGPWYASDDSLAHRQAAAKRLDRTRVVPLYALSMSYDERRERVMAAVRKELPPAGGGLAPAIDAWIPPNGLGDDWVVYSVGQPGSQKYYAVGYDIGPTGAVAFDGEAEEVAPSWESLADRVAQESLPPIDEITEMEPPPEGAPGPAPNQEINLPVSGAAHLKQTSWWKTFKASRAAMAKSQNLDKDEHGYGSYPRGGDAPRSEHSVGKEGKRALKEAERTGGSNLPPVPHPGSGSAPRDAADIKSKERELDAAKADYDNWANVSANAPGAPDVREKRDAAAAKVRALDREVKEGKKSLEGSVLRGQSEEMKRARYEAMHGKPPPSKKK